MPVATQGSQPWHLIDSDCSSTPVISGIRSAASHDALMVGLS